MAGQITYSGLCTMRLPRDGYTLPANYEEVFKALPPGVYVKCSACEHLHTDCTITIEDDPDTGRTYLCELCAKDPRHATR